MKWFNPKKVKNYLESTSNTAICDQTGFLYQTVGIDRVFLRNKTDYLSKEKLNKLCQNYYYKHYLPKELDTVVCIGAGLGHEAIWLKNKTNGVRYIGVEIQPYVYELLCNTFKQHQNFIASGSAINATNQNIFLSSAVNYTIVTSDAEGYIEVGSIKWDEFIAKFAIKQIDLLQINIEGAEKFLLPSINDYSNIKRVIISAHDFRADRGDGEQFRTREFVKDFLVKKGYKITHCDTKPRQMDWMFAEQITPTPSL